MATQAAGAEKPHVVFFPHATQGHITPALQLAKLLHRCKGFDVTFVLTEYNSRLLLRSRGPDALAGIPGFRFATVRDGLPPCDEYATHDYLVDILLSEETIMAPHFKKLISELPPVTCLISDVEHILRTSKAIGLPCVTFWIMSASSFLAFQQSQQLVDKGIVPLKGKFPADVHRISGKVFVASSRSSGATRPPPRASSQMTAVGIRISIHRC